VAQLIKHALAFAIADRFCNEKPEKSSSDGKDFLFLSKSWISEAGRATKS
jgi:hypothetical protein